MVEYDHVARIKGEPGWRQAERPGLAPDPCLHQGTAAAPVRFLWRHGHREAVRRHPRGLNCDPPGLDRNGVVILVRACDLPFQRLRQFRLLAAGQFHHVTLSGCRHVVRRDDGNRGAAAHGEADPALALECVEPEMPGQQGDRGAGRFQRRDHISVHSVGQAGNIDPRLRHPGAQTEVTNQRRQRDRAQPAGQPMPQPPVLAVGPDVRKFGEERIWPRIPCPGRAFRNRDHPLPVDRRDRVIRRIAPEQIGGFQIGPLDRVVAPAAGEIREEGL